MNAAPDRIPNCTGNGVKIAMQATNNPYPKYYFAYGSNLDAARLGGRIGRTIQAHEMQHGVLAGYEFALSKRGKCERCKHNGVAKANVVAKRDSAVEGVIYQIKNADEHEKLRKCEGHHLTPKEYEECDRMINTARGAVLCFFYIADAYVMAVENMSAEKHYLNYIRHGKEFFSERYSKQLETRFAAIELHQCNHTF